jgi:hypothetical protein
MLVDMITAEEARAKVFIEIQNSDLRKAKESIMSAIKQNKYGTILLPRDDGYINTNQVILDLKTLGYKIRKCPVEDLSVVFFLQWEQAPPEDLAEPTLCCNWEEI